MTQATDDLDVSSAIDLLLGGVIPERVNEVKEAWGDANNRVRRISSPVFLLQQAWGTIQVSETALSQIWLIGFAAQAAMQAHSSAIRALELLRLPFDFRQLQEMDEQVELDAAFSQRMEAIKSLGSIEFSDEYVWPVDTPDRSVQADTLNVDDKATYDLILMGTAYIFLHEIRHAIFENSGVRPERHLDEEIECDRYALDMLLGGVSKYAQSSGYSADLVFAKRLFGAVFAKLVILTLTPKEGWATDLQHPAVATRIRNVLDAADTRIPKKFWPYIAALLAAFARHFGCDDIQIESSSSRDLAFTICDHIEKMGK
ncbi:conserved hypothetical protein [Cupriavidus taiwanensis]|uniref:phage exclusion protein Lit family protein n=1 Tax=Cupriavidus taiwanensis TaxID=164546 RepID=UPI000E12CBD3|nr:phage exclusion protein Lit family protein [Cupriavidus taiwanensis]SOY78704.1 conserved hypothetical protein [Cupriavidus taiwanensis]SOY80491.1 conserved hypothetical protein [Cupriavidus taiwanensis]